MRIYIAYKYSKITNKEELKSHLLDLAKKLEEKKHSTFILGRDVQNWDNTTHSLSSKIKLMFSEINKSDAVFAYINTSDKSSGLLIEFHMAKLLGKKIILAINKDVSDRYYRKLATKLIEFQDFSDLVNKITNDSI